MFLIPFTVLICTAVLISCATTDQIVSKQIIRPPPARRDLCQVNVCFAFDGSGSVSVSEFSNAKTAGLQIVSSAGANSVYSAVNYSNEANVFLPVTNSYTTAYNAIFGNSKGNGGTYSDAGLEECKKLLVNTPLQPSAPKVIVLLTDGHDAHLAAVTNKASEIKGLGIDIVTVNVDSSSLASTVYNQRLRNIASHPSLAVLYSAYNTLLGRNGAFNRQICSRCCPAATICYAIDESGSISTSEFTEMKNAIAAITSTHNLLAPHSLYTATGFNGVAQEIPTIAIQGSTLFGASALINHVNGNAQDNGGTSIGSGIRQCAKYLNKASGVKIIVVLSDGYETTMPYGDNEAETASLSGIQLISMGIGNGVNEATLGEIASPNAFVKVSDFSSIYEAVGPIVKGICNIRRKLRPIPSTPVPMKPSTCVNILCTTCGRTQECFINSGNRDFDDEVCKSITSKNKATTDSFSSCKADNTQVTCTSNRSFGVFVSGDSPVCSSSRRSPTAFTRLQVCTDSSGESFSFKCSRPVCRGGDRGCWPTKMSPN